MLKFFITIDAVINRQQQVSCRVVSCLVVSFRRFNKYFSRTILNINYAKTITLHLYTLYLYIKNNGRDNFLSNKLFQLLTFLSQMALVVSIIISITNNSLNEVINIVHIFMLFTIKLKLLLNLLLNLFISTFANLHLFDD